MESSRSCTCSVLITAFLVFAGTRATGEIVRFELEGVILPDDFSDPGEIIPEVEPGDTFTGTLRYDTDIPELLGNSDPNFGTYILPTGFVPLSFSVEGLTFSSDTEVPADVVVVNDIDDPFFGTEVDQVQVYSNRADVPAGFGATPLEFALILISTDTSTLPTADLPASYDVDDWDERIVFFSAVLPDTGELLNITGEIQSIVPGIESPPELMAGDADRDLDFDQLDLVTVQVSAKYLSGGAATWGEGDWNGAPGGTADDPPPGDGQFNQLDIVAALTGGVYLTGPYAAVQPGGLTGDGQTSIGYDSATGEVWVDAPQGTELTSINIDSAGAIFTGEAAQNLGGSFDNDADDNIFKATFGGSFGALSFGNVAQSGLSEAFLLNDLSVVGSLSGGGGLGDVDLIYVPEPMSVSLLLLGMAVAALSTRGRINRG